MESKEILSEISSLIIEASIEMPIEELEQFDNVNSIKFIKKQKFHQKAALNKEKYSLLLNNVSEVTKQKIESLKNLSVDALLSLLKQRDVNFQFRNLDKLDEPQLREIIEDLYLLDDLKNEE